MAGTQWQSRTVDDSTQGSLAERLLGKQFESLNEELTTSLETHCRLFEGKHFFLLMTLELSPLMKAAVFQQQLRVTDCS